jgi:tRNA nucleotidyltransferase/poly(A) polymerase
VGEPAARIAEDYLRILRFFRFQSRYGRTQPDDETAQALRAAAPKLATLSAERLWSEFAKILSVADPRPALRLMETLGVLAALLPEADMGWHETFDRLVAAKAPADPVFRLAALIPSPEKAMAVASRLKFSNADRDLLLAVTDGPVPAPGADDGAVRRAVAGTEPKVLEARSFLRHDPDAAAAQFRAHLYLFPRPIFPLQGRDALALGLEPGPELGAALRQVRAWWLARGCVDDAAACRAELARVAARPAS